MKINLYREFVSKKCPRPVDTTSKFVYPIDGLLNHWQDALTKMSCAAQQCLVRTANGVSSYQEW